MLAAPVKSPSKRHSPASLFATLKQSHFALSTCELAPSARPKHFLVLVHGVKIDFPVQLCGRDFTPQKLIDAAS